MQKIIRTYTTDVYQDNNLDTLQKLLNEGYQVLFVTKVNNSVVEYILEKWRKTQ